VGFEVLTAVVKMSSIFWDIMQCCDVWVDFQLTARRSIPEDRTHPVKLALSMVKQKGEAPGTDSSYL
jgi:hypothetical protein